MQGAGESELCPQTHSSRLAQHSRDAVRKGEDTVRGSSMGQRSQLLVRGSLEPRSESSQGNTAMTSCKEKKQNNFFLPEEKVGLQR